MPFVRFAAPNTLVVQEGAGFVEFDVLLSEASAQTVTVRIQGGPANSPDLNTAEQTVSFAPGQTTARFRAAVTQDALYEGDEIFEFDIVGATGASPGGDTSNGTFATRLIVRLVDDDAPAAGPFTGGSGADVITGGPGADTVAGYGGDDVLDGGAGDDTVDGGAGSDRLTGGAGVDVVRGGLGDDVILAGPASTSSFGPLERLDGGEGVDTADFGAATGPVDARAADIRAGQSGSAGGLGAFALFSVENLIGSSFADTLTGPFDANVIRGAGGNDLLSGGQGDDVLDGGEGVDTASYAGEFKGIVADLRTGVVTGESTGRDTLTGIENLELSFYDDTAYGDAGANRIDGGNGWNVIFGGGGDDTLITGWGQLFGEQGNDTLLGGGAADLFGGQGNDTLQTESPTTAVDGGAGRDTLVVLASLDTLTLDLEQQGVQAFGTKLIGIPGVTPTTTETYARDVRGVENVNGSITGARHDLKGDAAANEFTADNLNDRLEGRAGDDALFGNGGDDVLLGGEGDDVLGGGAGVDQMDGGAGFDRVTFYRFDATQAVSVDLRTGRVSNDGFGNVEQLVGIEAVGGGTRFADTFRGNDGANLIQAEAGDTAEGFGGDDRFQIGSAPALVDGGGGVDEISLFSRLRLVQNAQGRTVTESSAGGVRVDLAAGRILDDGFGGSGAIAGIENLNGSEGGDELRGDAGANRLGGLGGDDQLFGAGGDDRLVGGAGNDRFDGGEGLDTADFSGAQLGVRVELWRELADSTGEGQDLFVSIENVTGGRFDDILAGSNGDNVLYAGAGDDQGRGMSGDDLLFMKDGRDTGYGMDGRDYVEGGGGDDLLFGGPGDDWVEGDWQAPWFDNGPEGADRLYGDEGNDVVRGGGGNGEVHGMSGDDRLDGGAGDDLIDGGEGVDTVEFTAAERGVNVALSETFPKHTFVGVDVILNVENAIGTRFDDALSGTGDDRSWGLDGNDLLFLKDGADTGYGEGGQDYVEGGGGDDQLFGGGGNDWLEGDWQQPWFDNGAPGNDRLNGDHGNDVLRGGAGQDRLDGGPGADRFVFASLTDSTVAAPDLILDFNGHEDRLDLSAIDADVSAAGDQGFRFVGGFSGRAGEAVLTYDAARDLSTLRLDVNGDGQADFALQLVGAHSPELGWVL